MQAIKPEKVKVCGSKITKVIDYYIPSSAPAAQKNHSGRFCYAYRSCPLDVRKRHKIEDEAGWSVKHALTDV